MVGQESVMVLNKCYTICSRVDCRPCVLRLDLVSCCIVSFGCGISACLFIRACFVLFRVLQIEIFGYSSSHFYTVMSEEVDTSPGMTWDYHYLDESKRLFRVDLL